MYGDAVDLGLAVAVGVGVLAAGGGWLVDDVFSGLFAGAACVQPTDGSCVSIIQVDAAGVEEEAVCGTGAAAVIHKVVDEVLGAGIGRAGTDSLVECTDTGMRCVVKGFHECFDDGLGSSHG